MRVVQVVDFTIHFVYLMIYISPTERVVNHCFTTRTGRTYGSWTSLYTLSLSNDIQFINSTSPEPLSHDPQESHESNESWNGTYTPSLSNDIQFTSCSTRKTLFNDLYDSYKWCEKEHTLIRVVSVRVYWTTLKANKPKVERWEK